LLDNYDVIHKECKSKDEQIRTINFVVKSLDEQSGFFNKEIELQLNNNANKMKNNEIENSSYIDNLRKQASKRINELLVKESDLSSQLSKQQEMLCSEGDFLKTTQEKLSVQLNENEKLVKELEEYKQECDQKGGVITNNNTDIKNLQDQITALTNEIRSNGDEFESLEQSYKKLQSAEEEKTLELTMLELQCKDKDNQIKILETNAFEHNQLFEEKVSELSSASDEMLLFKEKSDESKAEMENVKMDQK
jgi:chromosome segregation ATPase